MVQGPIRNLSAFVRTLCPQSIGARCRLSNLSTCFLARLLARESGSGTNWEINHLMAAHKRTWHWKCVNDPKKNVSINALCVLLLMVSWLQTTPTHTSARDQLVNWRHQFGFVHFAIAFLPQSPRAVIYQKKKIFSFRAFIAFLSCPARNNNAQTLSPVCARLALERTTERTASK